MKYIALAILLTTTLSPIPNNPSKPDSQPLEYFEDEDNLEETQLYEHVNLPTLQSLIATRQALQSQLADANEERRPHIYMLLTIIDRDIRRHPDRAR